MPSSHLILCCPLLLLLPIPPSIRVFSNESTLRMRWPKYWSFSFSIIPSKEIPGLISFRMDWLNLLAVQGALKSFLQHHSLKASILRCSAFFTVQLSHPYMTTAKAQAAATGALKHGREEPPHVRSQGQKPRGPHARRAVAKRSYPTFEVRGSGREYQTATAQEQRRGATPHPRSGKAARRSYPTSPRPRPGQRRGGATPCPRSRGCADAGGPRGAIPR